VRLQWGAAPIPPAASDIPSGWRQIDSPASRWAYALAALAGLVLLGSLCSALSAWSWFAPNQAGMGATGDAPSPWLAVSIPILLFVPFHEALHLLGQPGWGSTSRSVLVVWPAKLRFGVYFDGCMSRKRWLAMRLAPFVLLSVLPACLVVLLQSRPWAPHVLVGLQVMMVLNALGSGADIVAALLVLRQVPADGLLCFQAGRAYWRPA